MKLLTIDSATMVAGVSIVDEQRLIGELTVNYQKTHSEKLLTAVDHLLSDVGLRITEMDAFGIVAGPGSFTGLRIGMATAKGFAQALNKPMVTVSTLESLAHNLNCVTGLVCPILDARRNQVYTAVYKAEGDGRLNTICNEQAVGVETLIGYLKSYADQKIYVVGDGTARFGEQLKAALPQAVLVSRQHGLNRAGSAGVLAYEHLLQGKTCRYDQAALTYLRPSYAEEKHHGL